MVDQVFIQKEIKESWQGGQINHQLPNSLKFFTAKGFFYYMALTLLHRKTHLEFYCIPEDEDKMSQADDKMSNIHIHTSLRAVQFVNSSSERAVELSKNPFNRSKVS